VVVGGARVPVPFPVTCWFEAGGLDLGRYHGGHRAAGDVRMFLLHWDGCLSSRQCYHVLLERELSVQFLVDWDGTIYQCADALAWCFHGGPANRYSVGVEICNPVRPERAVHQDVRVERPVVEEREPHSGRPVRLLGFTAAQRAAVRNLTGWFCAHFGVPRRAPCLLPMKQLDGTADPAEVATTVVGGLVEGDFAGLAGHFHASANKVDPGFSLWPVVLGEHPEGLVPTGGNPGPREGA
jgi:hypothetical protein